VTTRLSAPFTFKAASVAATGEFGGYASTFGGSPDSYGDIVSEGAFAASLAKHRANGTQPALLWAHNPAAPIGRWLRMAEDGKGLAVEGRLTLEVERAREAHALMKDGALGLSIGFTTIADTYAADGTHVLKAVELWEVSAVAMPANSSARITSVRSRPGSLRDYEAALRSLNFSVREARHLATRGWPPAADPSSELAQIAERVNALTRKLGR